MQPREQSEDADPLDSRGRPPAVGRDNACAATPGRHLLRARCGPDSLTATDRGFSAHCHGAKRPLPGALPLGHAARTPVRAPAAGLPELRCRHAHRRVHDRGRPGAADSHPQRRAGRAATHQPGPRAARPSKPYPTGTPWPNRNPSRSSTSRCSSSRVPSPSRSLVVQTKLHVMHPSCPCRAPATQRQDTRQRTPAVSSPWASPPAPCALAEHLPSMLGSP